ncbi:transcriptional regulator, TetR family [Desulfovibrio sp. X2]|uniref:TetR/AcrR family transcriptional regulator n=1 Tax=Desulfovibrio sp. X2 TaxID=941449 RepID=UPI000358AB99|nr:TetR/AcrR family transcriptional regulator [Desulfovibrio sp. X2]EPR43778.1 transcriptional regulator, TetR family [Desulfovibrio sp. X2]
MRRAILDASLALFSKGGIKAVSMRSIAERIEYSPGTIYRYFDGKSAILRELRMGAFAIFYDRMAALESVADPVERLKAASRDYIAFALEHPEYYHLMFDTPDAPSLDDPDGIFPPMRSYRKFRSYVEACMQAGCIQGADPMVATISIWSTLHGLAGMLLAGTLRMIPEDQRLGVADKAVEFALR